jgi:hypothetical protein
MAASTGPEPVHTVWRFLGGYFLFFIGWMAAILGSNEFINSAQKDDPSVAIRLGYIFVAAGLVLFVAGVQVIARCYWGGFKAHPEINVIFVLTPLPAIAAVVINATGRYFRRAEGTVLRVLLVGGGMYLTGIVGVALVDGMHLTVAPEDLKAVIWPLIFQVGVAALLLGLIPPTRTEVTQEPELIPAD